MPSAWGLARTSAITALALLPLVAACAEGLGVDGAAGAGDGDGPSGAGATSGHGGAGGSTACLPGEEVGCYSGPAGTADVGICRAGTATCAPGGDGFGPCVGEVTPKSDDCATPADEDCDGQTPACPGAPLWAHAFGDAAAQVVTGAAVDAAGNVVLVGWFSGALDFGGPVLASAGLSDGFVVSLDAAGNHRWSRRFGDGAAQRANAVALDVNGNVFVGGELEGTASFGGVDLVSAGSTDGFVAKLGGNDGHEMWSRRFGDGAPQSVEALVIDGDGNAAVTGAIDGNVDFGGGPLLGFGGDDIYLAKLAGASGAHMFARRYGDASGSQHGAALTRVGQDVVMVASFIGTIDFGDTTVHSAGGSDLVVVRCDATGVPEWARQFGSTGDQFAAALTSDAGGNLVVAGPFTGTVSFGGAPLVSAGEDDVYMAKLDATGNHVWSRRYGDAESQAARGLAVAGDGDLVLLGSFAGAIDLGGGARQSAGGLDVFVARFDPSGAHLESKRFGAAADQRARALAVDATGGVVVAGDFTGVLDLGTGALQSAGDRDGFAARFAP
ncbi:MAG: hypothetical protein WKG00_22095 [Polyangiaceae bacterium]